MALGDVPLEDAGRDYYAQKFDNRVRNIRKYGNARSRSTGGRVNGWAGGAGVAAVLIGIRMMMLVVGGSQSSSTDYNNYRGYQAPTMPGDWDNNIQAEPQPWQVQPDEPKFRPDPPVILIPNAPPLGPDDHELPDKDD